MWSSVVCGVGGSNTPGARHKHAVCTSYPFVYLLGGRQGNLPLKDFWVYDLATRTWRQECEDKGCRPPSLQQHSMVAAQGKIFVYGGELCMSNETPLWVYEIQRRLWRKWKRPIGDEGGGDRRGLRRGEIDAPIGPRGRRGHVAVVVGNEMIIYGGYQDLRGSTPEIWSFNLQEESWQQVLLRGDQPPARHAHSAVAHDNQIWIYGGMTDLTERNDFWRYDISSRTWSQIRSRPNPGLLHSHVAVKLHSSMIIFGGERHGEVLNDLWRYHFGTGIWEKLLPSGVKPHPRSQCCAFVGPSLAAKHFRFSSGYSSLGGASSSSGSSSGSSGYSSSRSGDPYRNPQRMHFNQMGGKDFRREKSHYPSHLDDPNKVCGCRDCVEPSDEDEELDPQRLRNQIQRNCANSPVHSNPRLSISKFSQLNLSHLGKYYNYSMLSNDSIESIVDESLSSTCDSIVSKLTRSRSIHGSIKNDPLERGNLDDSRLSLSRDILSVPNFAELQDKSYHNDALQFSNIKLINVLPADASNEALLEEEPPDLLNGFKGQLALTGYENTVSTDTSISENLMSFSCTESSLSSISNYNLNSRNSFANPNYVGFDPDKEPVLLSQDYWSKGALDLESVRHKEFAELLKTPPDSGIGLGVEMDNRTPQELSISALEEFVSFDNKVSRLINHPLERKLIDVNSGQGFTSFAPGIGDSNVDKKSGDYTHSASRVTFSTDPVQMYSSPSSKPNERPVLYPQTTPRLKGRVNPFLKIDPPPEPEGPDAIYIIGGKETGQMTVFKRPISIWKLDLPY